MLGGSNQAQGPCSSQPPPSRSPTPSPHAGQQQLGEKKGAVVVGGQVTVLFPGTIRDAHHTWAAAGRWGGRARQQYPPSPFAIIMLRMAEPFIAPKYTDHNYCLTG